MRLARSVSDIEAALVESLQSLPKSRDWVVAYSGGLDSSVLLYACRRFCQDQSPVIPLSAIHVHHGLSKYADQWLLHCESVCASLQIPLHTSKVVVCQEGEGLEAAARKARYQVFANCLAPEKILLQGHHLNDQVETVIYRLIQGHGTQGLAGIPNHRPLADSELFRPLLGLSRNDLEVLASSWGLQWVEDDSNQDLDIARNYLRQAVIPPILNRWPSALARIATAAKRNAEAAELAQEVAVEDLTKCQGVDGPESIDLECLAELSQVRQVNLLRCWLQRHGMSFADPEMKVADLSSGGNISENRLTGVVEYLRHESTKGTRYHLSGQCYIAKYRKQLKIIKIDEPDTDWSAPWNLTESLETPQGILRIDSQKNGQLRMPGNDEKVTVRFRRGGERFYPPGRGGSCALKKWFQEQAIPEWERGRIPLIFYGDNLVAVADLVVDEHYQDSRGGLKLKWTLN